MSPRRGFLALVGGSLLSGAVLQRASATTPTLILPPSLDRPPLAPAFPLLAAHESEMHAVLHVKGALPPEDFQLWLSIGLRMAANARGAS